VRALPAASKADSSFATHAAKMLARCLTRATMMRASSNALRVAAAPALSSRRQMSGSSLFEGADDIDVDSVSYGFMASQAIFTGLELGLFDAIAAAGDSGLSIAALQQKCNVSAPRLQTLVTSLTAIQSLKRDAAGAYTLSPNTSKFLVTSSRAYYGDYLRYQMGRQFYHRMGALPDVMSTGEAPSYADWFSDPSTAATYTQAQHNGSVATAKYLVKKKLKLDGVVDMLDVGGGSGAFSYVFTGATPGLKSTVLELPEVCKTGEGIKANEPADVQERVKFVELDATSPDWPVSDGSYELVLMSYISGSVPESIIGALYKNAYKALKPGGRLLVHDFMVNDSLDGPALGALWALQHVTVNADGLGLCPENVISRMSDAGFQNAETMEMIHGLTKLIVSYKK